jgi:hypothetical protein
MQTCFHLPKTTSFCSHFRTSSTAHSCAHCNNCINARTKCTRAHWHVDACRTSRIARADRVNDNGKASIPHAHRSGSSRACGHPGKVWQREG